MRSDREQSDADQAVNIERNTADREQSDADQAVTVAQIEKLSASSDRNTTSAERLSVGVGRLRKSLRRGVAVLAVLVIAAAIFIWRFVSYSNCTTNRARTLTGPGNDRVTLFLDAFTASVTVRHLTPTARAADIAVLRKARETRYPLIPSDAALAKAPDAELAGDAQAVQALDTNTRYLKLAATHPVCTLWGI